VSAGGGNRVGGSAYRRVGVGGMSLEIDNFIDAISAIVRSLARSIHPADTPAANFLSQSCQRNKPSNVHGAISAKESPPPPKLVNLSAKRSKKSALGSMERDRRNKPSPLGFPKRAGPE